MRKLHFAHRRTRTGGDGGPPGVSLSAFKSFEHSVNFTDARLRLPAAPEGSSGRPPDEYVGEYAWGIHPNSRFDRMVAPLWKQWEAYMFVQTIETTSKRPIIEWRGFAPYAVPLFACAPEVLGTSFNYRRNLRRRRRRPIHPQGCRRRGAHLQNHAG